EVLNCPELSCAVKAHLNLVVNQKDFVFVQNFLERREIFWRRDNVTACALNRLDVEGREFSLSSFRIIERVVLGLEIFSELIYAIKAAVLSLFPIWAAEAIRERDEVRAV